MPPGRRARRGRTEGCSVRLPADPAAFLEEKELSKARLLYNDNNQCRDALSMTKDKEEKKPGFHPMYDWLAKDPELTSTEKLAISHIHRKGLRGCFESKKNFAKALGINTRTLSRSITRLESIDWIVIGYNTRPNTYWINEEKLKGKYVFSAFVGCGKPVRFSDKSLQMRLNRGGRFVHSVRRFVYSWGAFCHLFNRKRKVLLDIEDREDSLREKLSLRISEERKRKKPMTKAEFEAKRKLYHQQLLENS